MTTSPSASGDEVVASEDSVHLEDMDLEGAKPQTVDRIGLVSGTRGVWDRLARPDAREALLLSYASLACNGLAVVIGLIIAIAVGSPAVLAFSFENLIDLASSLLLVWRFAGGGAGKTAAALETREKRASVGIAGAMCILGVVVFSVGGVHLETHDPEERTHSGTLLGLSIPSILIFGVLGALKLHCANAVRSPAMRKDGICSAAGAVLSFAVCLGVTAWWIDPVVAMTVALLLFAFGFRTLHKNYVAGNRWWTAEWWGMPGRPTPASGKKVPGVELTRTSNADA